MDAGSKRANQTDLPPLEWREEFDRKSATSPGRKTVHYGGKVYLPLKRAKHGLGLPHPIVKEIFQNAKLPNGKVADVIHEVGTKQEYINEETLHKLQSRFVYADNRKRLGRCTVDNQSSLLRESPGSINKLRSVSSVHEAFACRFGQHYGTIDREVYARVGKLFSEWMEAGRGPDGSPIRKVLNTVTREELLTTRTVQSIFNGYRRTAGVTDGVLPGH